VTTKDFGSLYSQKLKLIALFRPGVAASTLSIAQAEQA
jgi:hypothetical protein